VPGRNPREAVDEYIAPLQRSLSCFSPGILRPSGYDTDILLQATFSYPTVELMTVGGEILHLSFVQGFSIIQPLFPKFGRYKVRTRSYIYQLENSNHQEILGFHWHPENTPDIQYPHMHIYQGAGDNIRQEIRNIHFRTDRFAFEEFCQLLIKEFRVVPDRDDAEEVLSQNLRKFQNYKTW
jgi:hypothetical protein